MAGDVITIKDVQMTDNVIILGAGASVDAGVPLLDKFVDKMLEFGQKGQVGDKALSDEDLKIFGEATKVRKELDGYHGRAAFDDRNIEDILSILSFNLMVGGKKERNKLGWMIKAIARTIELTTTAKFDNKRTREIQADEGMTIYLDFWHNLFNVFSKQRHFPAIISFNYDLVLERALFQLLINTYFRQFDEYRFPSDGIILKYYYDALENFSYQVRYITYLQHTQIGIENLAGSTLSACNGHELKNPVNIELLNVGGHDIVNKFRGSITLNWVATS